MTTNTNLLNLLRNNLWLGIGLSLILFISPYTAIAKNYLLISESTTCDDYDISVLNKEIENLCNSSDIVKAKLCIKNSETNKGCNTIKCFLVEKGLLSAESCNIADVTAGFISKWKNIAAITTKADLSIFDCRTSENKNVCVDLNQNTPFCDEATGECKSCSNLGSNSYCKGLDLNTPICDQETGSCKSCNDFGGDTYCSGVSPQNPICDTSSGSCQSCTSLGGNNYCLGLFTEKSICDQESGVCKSCNDFGGDSYCKEQSKDRDICNKETGKCISSSSCLNKGGNSYCLREDASKPFCDRFTEECKSCLALGGSNFCTKLNTAGKESCYTSGDCGPKLPECPCFTFESLKKDWQNKPDTTTNLTDPNVVHKLSKFQLSIRKPTGDSKEISLAGFGLPVSYSKTLNTTDGDLEVKDNYFPGQLLLSSSKLSCSGYIKSPFQYFNDLEFGTRKVKANHNLETLNDYTQQKFENISGLDGEKANESCTVQILMFNDWLQQPENNP